MKRVISSAWSVSSRRRRTLSQMHGMIDPVEFQTLPYTAAVRRQLLGWMMNDAPAAPFKRPYKVEGALALSVDTNTAASRHSSLTLRALMAPSRMISLAICQFLEYSSICFIDAAQ